MAFETRKAQVAESTPPERPRISLENPCFLRVERIKEMMRVVSLTELIFSIQRVMLIGYGDAARFGQV